MQNVSHTQLKTQESVVEETIESKTEIQIKNEPDLPEITTDTKTADVEGVKASEDPRFKKFFKMVQFGVPESAVKLKMKSEDVDPDILK